jgi:hypothetical protein
MTYTEMRPLRTRDGSVAVATADSLSTDQLRARYEAMRADQIAQARYFATRGLVKHGLLILIALVLFVTHWRWVRNQRDTT